MRFFAAVCALMEGVGCTEAVPRRPVRVAPVELVEMADSPLPAPQTSSSPVSPAYEGPCELADAFTAGGDRRSLIKQASVLARMAATERDVECAAAFVKRHFPEFVEREPPPLGVAEFRAWWRDFGGSLHVRFGPDWLTVLPERRPALEGNARAHLSPLLCPMGDATCGEEAREFLRDAEQRLKVLESLHELEQQIEKSGPVPPPGEDVELALCASDALEKPPTESFDAWRACVVERMPKELLAPREAFRLPERGTLTLNRFGYWDPCAQKTSLSLATGLALTRVTCTVPTPARRMERWTLRRTQPRAARQAALFALLSEHFASSPSYAAAYAIPSGIRRSDDVAGSVFSSGPLVSDAPTLAFELEGVLAVPLHEQRYVHDETEPLKQLEVALLLPLGDGGQASCATVAEIPEVERLVAKIEAPEAAPARAATLRCEPAR